MDEYISRQKALEEMHKWCDPCGSGIEAILAVPAEGVVSMDKYKKVCEQLDFMRSRYKKLEKCLIKASFGYAGDTYV